MPISYETEQPLSPAISALYGKGEVEDKNNAVLANQAAETNRLRVSAAEANAQRAFAASQAGLDRAQRQTVADYGNAQQSLNIDAQVEQHRADRELSRQQLAASLQPSGRDYFLANERQKEAVQDAQLKSWLFGQELSQKENLDLQRYRASASEVMARDDLTDGEKRDLLFQLKTHIDPLEQRQKAAQARMMQEHAAKFQADAAMETQVRTRNAALDAKTLGDRTHYTLDPAVQAEVEAELGPITQEEVAQFGANAPQARQRKVAEIVARRGGLLGYSIQTGYDAHGRPQFEHKEYATRGGKAGKEEKPADEYGRTPADYHRDWKDAVSFVQDQEKARKAADPQARPLTTEERAANAMEFMRQLRWKDDFADNFRPRGQQPGGPPPGPPPRPTAPPPADAKPFRPDDPATMDATQSSLVRRGNADLQAIQARPDLPDGQKQFAELAMRDAIDLLARYGSVERMKKESPDAYRLWERHKAELSRLAPPPAAPPPQAPPPLRLSGESAAPGI